MYLASCTVVDGVLGPWCAVDAAESFHASGRTWPLHVFRRLGIGSHRIYSTAHTCLVSSQCFLVVTLHYCIMVNGILGPGGA